MVGKHWTFVIMVAGALMSGVVIGWRTAMPHGAVYFMPGPGCENHIISEIAHAKKIDIAVYAITNQNIVDAIISAHRRGAQIRIITDRIMAGQKSGRVAELAGAGIPVRRHRRHKIEHNKFAVFDNRRIATGSFNWTDNATKYNSENCLFLDMMAAEYSARFDYLWDMYGE